MPHPGLVHRRIPRWAKVLLGLIATLIGITVAIGLLAGGNDRIDIAALNAKSHAAVGYYGG